jgi:hypothetical protein
LPTSIKAKVTVEELRNTFAAKLGFRREHFDFYRIRGGWDASLLAYPGWTPASNAQVKQLALALQPHFELIA